MVRSGAQVLLIEDDPSVARGMVDLLETNGHQVCCAENGAQAKAMLRQFQPDLVVLDLMLPDVDGLVLCGEIRSLNNVPIIICSGTVRRRDSVLGLKLGADDFIPKPFEPAEFEARVEAVLRRTQASRMADTSATAASPQRLRVGALEMDHALQRATLGGLPLALTPTEFRLLLALASRPNTVLSREELAHHVWGDHQLTSVRAIDVHVFRLREKLARGSETAPTLVSVRSFGYQLSTEAATSGFAAAC